MRVRYSGIAGDAVPFVRVDGFVVVKAAFAFP